MPTSPSCNSATVSRSRPATALRATALSVLAYSLCAGCTVWAEEPPPNVILICLDTVGANHVGAYGYDRRPTTPYLDGLAARSTFFVDASATAGWTKPSVPSFLTGTYPVRHGVYEGSASLDVGEVTDVLPEASVTLAEVLRGQGYRTAAFIRNAQLRRGNGFEQGFELYRDEAGDADEILRHATEWLDGREGDRPFFLYLHFLDAHWPYDVPDEYATRFADLEAITPFRGKESRELRDRVNDGERTLSASERSALEDLYDGSIRYLDDRLAEFEAGLVERELARNTVICVVSDHGEEFGEHGRLGHGHGLWENLLRVVWILYDPASEPERVQDPVSLVDLFPTLLARLGFEDLPEMGRVDGVVRGGGESGHGGRVFAEHKAPDRYIQSVRSGGAKRVRTFVPPQPDPGTVHPVGVGERWEAELTRSEDGELLCLQLKPRDEDPGDPLEIKGAIGDLDEGELSIGGLSIRFAPEQAVAKDDDRGLFVGRVVKVKADLSSGRYVARRIKFYSPEETSPFELRGPVESLEVEGGRGRALIAGQWIRIDGSTRIKAEKKPRRLPMTREQVVRSIEAGGEGARELGFAVTARATDLGSDPQELGDSAELGLDDPVLRDLDRFVEELGRRRLFGEDDRLFLSRDAVEDLRALGYVE